MAMRCLAAPGKRIMASGPDSQTADMQIRIALVTGFAALRTAGIRRVAGPQPGKGKSRHVTA